MHRRLATVFITVLAGLIGSGALSPAAATAGAVHQEFVFPQPPVYVDCLGEELEGLFHIREVSHIRESANGGFHLTMTATQKGVLEGLSSGSTWTFKGTSKASFNTQGDQAQFTSVAPLTGVSPGNPVLVATFRVVAAFANGVLTTFHSVDSVRCQGKPN